MSELVAGILAGILLTLAAQTLGLLMLDMRAADRRGRRAARH